MQKLQVLIYNAVEMKRFIVLSLLKQTSFLVMLMDIETNAETINQLSE